MCVFLIGPAISELENEMKAIEARRIKTYYTHPHHLGQYNYNVY